MAKLNPRQELFCRYYATNEVGTFGNATQSYLKVYPNSSEEAAWVSSYDLLRKPKIVENLKELYTKNMRLTDKFKGKKGIVPVPSDVDAREGIITQARFEYKNCPQCKHYIRLTHEK